MRALAISSRESTPEVQDLPAPAPGAGQVRVAVQAASVNGLDLNVAAGYVWDVFPHEFPVVLGRDFAGTVEAVGDGVEEVRVGEAVFGVITDFDLSTGAIADLVTLDARKVVALPSLVTPAQAAAVGLAGVTAYDLIDALDVKADDVVLVSGATGGVGALATQFAVARGARVLATAKPGAAADFVTGLGASDAIDYSTDLIGRVRSAAPNGVNKIVHAAGDAAQLGELLDAGGRLASAIGATAEAVGRSDVTVIGLGAVATPEKLNALLAAVENGSVQASVTRTYALEDAAQAVRDFGSGKLGKLVITIP